MAGILVLAGCRKGETGKTASLYSVTVTSQKVTLSPGGESVFSFSVLPEDVTFNYHVGIQGCRLSLQGPGGSSPVHFRMTSVVRTGPGAYTATIRDTEMGETFEESVRIVYSDEGGTVYSSFFSVVGIESPNLAPYEKTGLPVVYLDTESPVVSKDNLVSGVMKIDGRGLFPDLLPVGCRVKGRGNSTWEWPKKPYSVRLDSKQEILGMPRHKRWVLLANFLDRTLMRNIVSMHVGGMMTALAWTPRCRSVELVLNGEHVGNYLLIEQVRIDGDRVDIGGPGAFMVESDFHFNNTVQWVDYGGGGGGFPFAVRYPDPDSVSTAQVNYIKEQLSGAVKALYGNDFKTEYPKYLDVDSFVDYWIVFELMGNHELQNPGSVFTHKDDGGLLTAGPLWDFDWGVLSYKTSPRAQYSLINEHAVWYDRLFQDPAFRAKVKARWQQLLPDLQTVPAFIEKQKKVLESSAMLNFAMWNPADDASMNGGSIINGDENMSFSDAVDRLESIYRDRLRVISEKL